jgi:hypothetical protein
MAAHKEARFGCARRRSKSVYKQTKGASNVRFDSSNGITAAIYVDLKRCIGATLLAGKREFNVAIGSVGKVRGRGGLPSVRASAADAVSTVQQRPVPDKCDNLKYFAIKRRPDGTPT